MLIDHVFDIKDPLLQDELVVSDLLSGNFVEIADFLVRDSHGVLRGRIS